MAGGLRREFEWIGKQGLGDSLDYLGCNDLAWTAPGCETIEDHEGVFLLHG